MSTYYDYNEGRERWIVGRIRKAAWRAWDEVVGPDLVYRLQATLERDRATDCDEVWAIVETEVQHICISCLYEIWDDITMGARALFMDHDAALGALEMRDGRIYTWLEPDTWHIHSIVETEFHENRLCDLVLGMAIAVAYIWNKNHKTKEA